MQGIAVTVRELQQAQCQPAQQGRGQPGADDDQYQPGHLPVLHIEDREIRQIIRQTGDGRVVTEQLPEMGDLLHCGVGNFPDTTVVIAGYPLQIEGQGVVRQGQGGDLVPVAGQAVIPVPLRVGG